MVYTWRVHTSGESFSNFQTPGPGARGPTGGPSCGSSLVSLYTWRVVFKKHHLFKFLVLKSLSQGPGGQLGGPSYGLPLESLYTWKVLLKVPNFNSSLLQFFTSSILRFFNSSILQYFIYSIIHKSIHLSMSSFFNVTFTI